MVESEVEIPPVGQRNIVVGIIIIVIIIMVQFQANNTQLVNSAGANVLIKVPAEKHIT